MPVKNTVTLRLDDDLLNAVEVERMKMCERHYGVNRAQALRALIRRGLDDAQRERDALAHSAKELEG